MCFLKIAIEWPMLMKHWESVEKYMPTFQNVNCKRNKMHWMKGCAWSFLTIALSKYFLNSIQSFKNINIFEHDFFFLKLNMF